MRVAFRPSFLLKDRALHLHPVEQMDGTGYPKILFEYLEFTPIQPSFWIVSTLRHWPGKG